MLQCESAAVTSPKDMCILSHILLWAEEFSPVEGILDLKLQVKVISRGHSDPPS